MTVRYTLSFSAAAVVAVCAIVGTIPDLSYAGPGVPGAPLQLLPSPKTQEVPPSTSPDAVAPAQTDGAPAADSSAPGSTETAIGGIRIDNLAPLVLQADGVGTIDGLGPDLWRGTSRALIASYLPRLPLPTTSPAVRGLVDKLLLTSAAPPPAAAGTVPESLLDMRLGRLAVMGDADNFVALARALPNGNDEVSTRARVEADFLTGDDGAACAEVSAPDRVASLHGEFWNRASTVCNLVAGHTAPVQLALDVTTEQSPTDDSPYVLLLRAALGNRTAIANLAGAGPLEATLLRLSKAEVAPAALETASPLALRIMALNDGKSPVRLDAAERAEALGAITTGKLAEIYSAVAFKKDELANALTVAAADASARGRALFYQAEEGQQVPAAKAEVIKAALSAASSAAYGQTARLYSKAIAAIDPAPELTWFAADAARVLYATGNVARANDWRSLLARDPANASAQTGLWLLSTIGSAPVGAPVAMADASGNAVAAPSLLKPLDSAGFKAWLSSFPEADRPAKAAVALTLLDSLGVSIPAETWAPYLDAAPLSSRTSPLLAPLARAAEGGRSGEAVLLGLAALGSGNPEQWPLETVAAVDRALARLNLVADARTLATEAALAAGL